MLLVATRGRDALGVLNFFINLASYVNYYSKTLASDGKLDVDKSIIQALYSCLIPYPRLDMDESHNQACAYTAMRACTRTAWPFIEGFEYRAALIEGFE